MSRPSHQDTVALGLRPSELGWRLQLARGVLWQVAATGDPYALLLRCQEDDPQPWHERARGLGRLHRGRLGVWTTADHRLAAELLADERLGLRRRDGGVPPQLVLPLPEARLGLERPQFEEVRRLAAPLLAPAAVARVEERAVRTCHRLLDRLDGGFDLMAAYARPVAQQVVGDVFDLPPPERTRLRDHWSGLELALDSMFSPQPLPATRAVLRAVGELTVVFARLLGMAVVWAATIANTIGNTVLALLDDPPQWRALAAEPALAGAAVAEASRLHPPVQLHLRVAHRPVPVAGARVEPDNQVAILAGAAGRDPAVYPDPARFDLRRRHPTASLFRQAGFHCGLAAPLVEASAGAAVRALAGRVPSLRVPAGATPLRRRRAPVTRPLLDLPVAVNG